MNAYKYLFLLFFTLISVKSFAGTCTNNSGQQAFLIDFGQVTVARSVTAGTTVATKTGTFNVNYTCPDNTVPYVESVNNNTPLGNNLYDIGISGFGVRFSVYRAGGIFDHYFPNTVYSTGSNYTYTYQIDLVRTSNTAKSGSLATVQIANASITNQFFIATWNVTGGYINYLPCDMSTSSLNFPIGTIPGSSFGTSVGTTPANAQATNTLALSCNTGANVSISLIGVQNPDVSNTSVLALSGQGGAGVAKGVGVQMLYGGTILNLNSPVQVTTSSSGSESIPLTARYYQTKTNVSAGTANAIATLNIIYQ
ncbi:fimbrial protein [Enterobacter bugandensis]|uniref:fimbrial protein n=3 Tax=Enterobacter TaxID=547 RepID=UPI001D0C8237|nr:fimbrial protein [Enterobacter bugandensis]MCC2000686.1 fimbrial protein [Enterobacter bugandensis]